MFLQGALLWESMVMLRNALLSLIFPWFTLIIVCLVNHMRLWDILIPLVVWCIVILEVSFIYIIILYPSLCYDFIHHVELIYWTIYILFYLNPKFESIVYGWVYSFYLDYHTILFLRKLSTTNHPIIIYEFSI